MVVDIEHRFFRRNFGSSKFEAICLMEDLCEKEVATLLEITSSILDKLKFVSMGLNKWYGVIRRSKHLNEDSLRDQLEQLSSLFLIEDVLEELVDARLAMNMKSDKEECY